MAEHFLNQVIEEMLTAEGFTRSPSGLFVEKGRKGDAGISVAVNAQKKQVNLYVLDTNGNGFFKVQCYPDGKAKELIGVMVAAPVEAYRALFITAKTKAKGKTKEA